MWHPWPGESKFLIFIFKLICMMYAKNFFNENKPRDYVCMWHLIQLINIIYIIEQV
jgi:hypothetical protein